LTSETFGDAAAGFEIRVDASAKIVAVKSWGFWDRETGSTFSPRVIRACRSIAAAQLLIDARELKPMRDEGQASFVTLLRALPNLRVSVTVRSHLVKLQFLRISQEQKAQERVEIVEPGS
jgi:hypothetical protein